MKRTRMISAAISAALLAAAGGLAYAQQGPFAAQNDALAGLSDARVSLVQAIAAAEQHVGGRAARAHLERENGAAVFDVEVVTAANAVMDVKVGADGKVLAAVQDSNDEGDREDREGGEGEDARD